MLRRVFHLVALFSYVFSLGYDQMYVEIKRDNEVVPRYFFKGRLIYLTIWNMIRLWFTLDLKSVKAVKSVNSGTSLDVYSQCYNRLSMTTVRTFFHILATAHFAFGCFYDWKYVNVPIEVHRMGSAFGGKLKFLTFWDALIQTFFFAVCTLNDVIGTNEVDPQKKPFIRKFKDKLLACLGFPLSMFVGLTFWAIYFVDRELVFPRALDAFFPVWLNHVMHTNIMIFIFIEIFTSYSQYPTRKFGLTVLTIFMVSYLVWIHIIHAKTGLWVYPVLDVLNLPLRIVFFGALLGLIVVLYIVGEKLNKIIWAKTTKKESNKKRR